MFLNGSVRDSVESSWKHPSLTSWSLYLWFFTQFRHVQFQVVQMREWSPFTKFTQAILLFLDQSIIFTLSCHSAKSFSAQNGHFPWHGCSPGWGPDGSHSFAVPGPWSDYCVNPSRWHTAQKHSRFGRVGGRLTSGGNSGCRPRGKWETLEEWAHLLKLDLRRDWDSSELLTVYFSFAFSYVINSSFSFQKYVLHPASQRWLG